MYTDRVLILFILGVYLMSPALVSWWGEAGHQWYRPYAVWLGLIAVSYWVARQRSSDGL